MVSFVPDQSAAALPRTRVVSEADPSQPFSTRLCSRWWRAFSELAFGVIAFIGRPGACVANEMPAARIDIISKLSSTILGVRTEVYSHENARGGAPEDLQPKEGPELSELT
jgi:hypothetical protein